MRRDSVAASVRACCCCWRRYAFRSACSACRRLALDASRACFPMSPDGAPGRAGGTSGLGGRNRSVRHGGSLPALLAQQAEHIHGKDEVTRSIRVEGSAVVRDHVGEPRHRLLQPCAAVRAAMYSRQRRPTVRSRSGQSPSMSYGSTARGRSSTNWRPRRSKWIPRSDVQQLRPSRASRNSSSFMPCRSSGDTHPARPASCAESIRAAHQASHATLRPQRRGSAFNTPRCTHRTRCRSLPDLDRQ